MAVDELIQGRVGTHFCFAYLRKAGTGVRCGVGIDGRRRALHILPGMDRGKFLLSASGRDIGSQIHAGRLESNGGFVDMAGLGAVRIVRYPSHEMPGIIHYLEAHSLAVSACRIGDYNISSLNKPAGNVEGYAAFARRSFGKGGVVRGEAAAHLFSTVGAQHHPGDIVRSMAAGVDSQPDEAHGGGEAHAGSRFAGSEHQSSGRVETASHVILPGGQRDGSGAGGIGCQCRCRIQCVIGRIENSVENESRAFSRHEAVFQSLGGGAVDVDHVARLP